MSGIPCITSGSSLMIARDFGDRKICIINSCFTNSCIGYRNGFMIVRPMIMNQLRKGMFERLFHIIVPDQPTVYFTSLCRVVHLSTDCKLPITGTPMQYTHWYNAGSQYSFLFCPWPSPIPITVRWLDIISQYALYLHGQTLNANLIWLYYPYSFVYSRLCMVIIHVYLPYIAHCSTSLF